ncbi:hypothetical protein HHL16_03595 [Pseudoflavitalea sp. G-6-1-2]|uniref:hypothetical protein n=1 Tax=Pseudoflavitalea sp. G-6-1-2 TaxID=2728841 RepID=UPI00146EE80F|nr:hypothetical protein [Pseudoflavitalea sp. G-6-1-2]NML19940.1 hypothetical protein [Pseudoflavitalea sp. G-6-1-2]
MIQKRYVITGTFLLCWCCTLVAQQLKLGTNPTTLTRAAVLELSSSNQGLLFTRLSDTVAINTYTPPDGTVIYFTPTNQLMIRINSAWQPIASGKSAAANAWSTAGNSNGSIKILGNLDNFDLPIYTNNAERMRISSAGNVAIGATSFDATYPEKLLINAGSTTSVNALYAKGSINNYFQINIQNQASSAKASSDIVATANNGTETTNFVNIGINGSGWVVSPSNNIGTGQANDAYLLGAGNDLYIANNNTTKSILFLTGGTQAANEAMRITSAGNVGVATTSPAAKADVNGTFKLGAKGNVNKNQISFAGSIPANSSIPAASLVILGVSYAPGVPTTDYVFNVPAANAPTSTQATVSVSFGQDLPANCGVAFARLLLNGSTYQVKVRIHNYGTSTATFSAATPVYITITEF